MRCPDVSGSDPWSRAPFSSDGRNRHQESACPPTFFRHPSPRSRRRSLPERSPAPVGLAEWVTALIVAAPFGALLYALLALWGAASTSATSCSPRSLFFLVGHGITIGFHRLLAHKSFVAFRPLKLALIGAGSMAFEGGPIGWVADHRRHHVFSDRDGDPHSPHGTDGSPLHGLWHAHIGWLFNHEPTSWPRHAARPLGRPRPWS